MRQDLLCVFNFLVCLKETTTLVAFCIIIIILMTKYVNVILGNSTIKKAPRFNFYSVLFLVMGTQNFVYDSFYHSNYTGLESFDVDIVCLWFPTYLRIHENIIVISFLSMSVIKWVFRLKKKNMLLQKH